MGISSVAPFTGQGGYFGQQNTPMSSLNFPGSSMPGPVGLMQSPQVNLPNPAGYNADYLAKWHPELTPSAPTPNTAQVGNPAATAPAPIPPITGGSPGNINSSPTSSSPGSNSYAFKIPNMGGTYTYFLNDGTVRIAGGNLGPGNPTWDQLPVAPTGLFNVQAGPGGQWGTYDQSNPMLNQFTPLKMPPMPSQTASVPSSSMTMTQPSPQESMRGTRPAYPTFRI